ncbi:hypothetical protein ES708_23345 [subsurface metagenome]
MILFGPRMILTLRLIQLQITVLNLNLVIGLMDKYLQLILMVFLSELIHLILPFLILTEIQLQIP